MGPKLTICIPSKRKPPFKTLENFRIPEAYGLETFIISDPALYTEHREYYDGYKNIHVVRGGVGIGQQMWNTYLVAHEAGYDRFLRLDDDLDPKTFVARSVEGKTKYLDLEEALHHLNTCMRLTDTTLVGFSNTSRLDWLGNGYKRTYGLIHSGACLSVSSNTPQLFMDRTLTKWGDVYQTCAHRKYAGAVGRVAFVGFDKSVSTKNSTIHVTKDEAERNQDIILGEFQDMLSIHGTKWIHNDTVEIVNWRMKRDPNYKKDTPEPKVY